tara:strand:- start:631 stop:1218 length:588 start_codon:yes stop_codon:yes gene_type:complete
MRFYLLTALLLSFIFITAPSFAQSTEKTAIFAGGCFWCMEAEFEDIEGVSDVISGYTGGEIDDPTYKQVSGGDTGHYEAIEVTYDSDVVNYSQLLDIFWSNVNPLDIEGQFCDKGQQYQAVIFYGDEAEKKIAEASFEAVQGKFDKRVVTKILPKSEFFEAEEYHQDYYKKNAMQYKLYKWNCGRDQELEEIWQE